MQAAKGTTIVLNWRAHLSPINVVRFLPPFVCFFVSRSTEL